MIIAEMLLIHVGIGYGGIINRPFLTDYILIK